MHSSRQTGSTLIIVIGVLAALAVVFASLVVLTGNVLSNSGDERLRSKAFHVAEAGLDAGLYVLGANWPKKDSTIVPVVDAAAVRQRFPVSEFPDPHGVAFIDVRFYDNSDTNGDGAIDAEDAPRDVNDDNLVFVDSEAHVGAQAARVRALAERQTVTLDLPRGVALYAGGDVWMHGGGTPVGVEVPARDAQGNPLNATAYIGGTLKDSGQADFSSAITVKTTGVPDPSEILNPDILNLLRTIAQESGRYYTDVKSAEEALATGPLVYLKTTGDVTITANGVYNGDGTTYPPGNPKPPGILIVDGGSVTFHGTPIYYGIVYCTKGFIDVGNAEIHGMVVSASGTTELGGSDQVLYNDNCIVNLDEVVTLAARVYPGSWRQLAPRDR